jgi:hypothetical protein
MLLEVDSDPVEDPAHEASPTLDFKRVDKKQTELDVCLGRHR